MAATVGVGRWVLHIPGCTSLKSKRMVVNSLRDRLRGEFEVSVAETDFQDKWQKAELSVAFVTSDRKLADSLLSRVEDTVEDEARARIIERETAFF
ncbi:MAG: DUF503 domain-containing protein [Candidatus Palauibacterales bacterium]|nr:DUF503 domain-containing protein [Candidatus Palauibacterales bacterium]